MLKEYSLQIILDQAVELTIAQAVKQSMRDMAGRAEEVTKTAKPIEQRKAQRAARIYISIRKNSF